MTEQGDLGLLCLPWDHTIISAASDLAVHSEDTAMAMLRQTKVPCAGGSLAAAKRTAKNYVTYLCLGRQKCCHSREPGEKLTYCCLWLVPE